jgi:hypothetical protein
MFGDLEGHEQLLSQGSGRLALPAHDMVRDLRDLKLEGDVVVRYCL